ncbi:MAG TPA: carboxypeptidase-like regulatory domain-containing protein, partial [Roseiflexaceae bacterium]
MGQLGTATAAPSAARPASHSSESAAPGAGFQPTVRAAIKHDLSPELRSIVPAAPSATGGNIPLRRLHPPARGAQSSRAEADPVVQRSPGIASMPTPIRTFEGVGNFFGGWPPDTEGDVGPNHYVQFINDHFAIWNKSGTLLYGPAPGNTPWAGFGGPCETTNDGDPIVQYDHLADRWMLSQFGNAFTDGPYYQCIAVSKTGDPTGAYYRYAFKINDTKLNDYPKFGVWPDAYYMTINQFLGNSYAGAGAIAFERAQMLAGRPARMVYFDLESVDIHFGGMLPSDLDGPPPPAGSPNYFAEVDDTSNIGTNDAMRLWRFHVDWANPANSTFGQTGVNAGQPNNTLNVASFTPLCPTTSDCIPQPGTLQKLDAIGDRLMYRLQYRNFGSHQSLVVNHTVDAGAGRAGVRWYEVRNPGGTPAIFQQSTYAPSDTESRWMASAAQDRQGNLAIGFSASSSTVFPAIRYAGRLVSDPLNNLSQGEAVMQAGGGSQTGANRWGDYSMLAVDSTDDCTFWYTTEYYPTTSDADWHTRIGAFKFPGCTSAPTGGLQGTVTKAAGGGPIAGALVQAGAYSTFSDASGHYQFLHLPAGTYTATASAYGYTSQTASGIVVTVGVTTTHNFSLTALPTATVQGT